MIKYLKYLRYKRLITKSGLFDIKYYLFNYNDIRKNDIEPIEHYLKYGVKDSRNPSKNFNTSWYINQYKDVKASGINPLVHYILYGQKEGRKINNIKKVAKIINKRPKRKTNNYNDILLYGALKKIEKFDLVNQEYRYTKQRMLIQEEYLINWNIEKNKFKKKDFISIIIPLYGQSKLTDNCLESLFNTKVKSNFEIILVNNSQAEEDILSLKKWEDNSSIKIINNDENLNFALGCNQGFSRSIGDIVVFLNNDTTVTDNWLDELILPLEDENISSVQPKLLYPDGTLQCMGIEFNKETNIGYPIYQNQDIEEKILNRSRKFQAVTAACMALRSEDFALAKGFDVNFVNGQEDIDLCLRLNTIKNSSSYYTSKSTVYHYEGKSKGRGKFIAQNRKTFLDRHTEPILTNNNRIFLIKGKKDLNINLKTIMVSTHVVSKVLYGGQRSFLDMIQALNIYNIIVTIPNNSNQDYINMLAKYCHKIYVVNYKFWSFKNQNQNAIDTLELIIKKNYIDLVYVNTIVCREPLLAAKALDIPRVIHIREIIDNDKSLRDAIGINDSQEIIKELKNISNILICNSNSTAKMFNNQELEVIYNRVDIDSFKNIKPHSNSKIRFAIISGNEPKKGIFDFVEIAKMAKDITNIEFLIIGHRNSHIKIIEQKIKKENILNLKLMGYYNNPVDAISQCDVVMSLSHVKESFGRTVAEAMAGKKAVIAYKWGAMPELITHNITGFLCEYMNLNQVFNAIKRLANQPELITKMGEEGFYKIQKISNTEIYNKSIQKVIENQLSPKEIKIKTTVIIPIYNAYNEVIDCIDSVINSVEIKNTEILLINDCSTDIRIKKLLDKYINIKNISIYHNNINLGYTININKAIKLSKGKDIVLLNSDTITTNGWLESMIDVAYSTDTIGTVTAMSDNAGAFSFPSNDKGNIMKPNTITYNNYAKLIIQETSKLSPIEVPTGSGFCLYIKGELLDDIGLFDEKLFPRGYGEENDFCLRAKASNWINIISTTTFIFHVRTASFKDEKVKLVKDARGHILKKYPNYTEMIQKAFKSDIMQKLNQQAIQAVNNMKSKGAI